MRERKQGNAVLEAARGLKSLLVGLGVTGKNYASPQITVHYPRKVVKELAGYRGHIELVLGEGADPRCIACGMCARVCPSGCIKMVAAKKEDKPKAPRAKLVGEALVPSGEAKPAKAEAPRVRPESFELDFTLCSLCGLCAQSCPVEAIRFSQDLYLASPEVKDYHYDLMADMRRRSGLAPLPAAQPAAEAPGSPA